MNLGILEEEQRAPGPIIVNGVRYLRASEAYLIKEDNLQFYRNDIEICRTVSFKKEIGIIRFAIKNFEFEPFWQLNLFQQMQFLIGFSPGKSYWLDPRDFGPWLAPEFIPTEENYINKPDDWMIGRIVKPGSLESCCSQWWYLLPWKDYVNPLPLEGIVRLY